MVGNFKVKLVRFLGWVLFLLSLCIFIAGLVANEGQASDYAIIGFFAVTGFLGFLLMRYKKGKKADSPENKETPKKTLAEKLQEQKEKSIQKQIELQNKLNSRKNPPKSPEELLPPVQNQPNMQEKRDETRIIMDIKPKTDIEKLALVKDPNIRIETLERLILKYQKSYYDGEGEISDGEFDLLWEELKALNPNSLVFGKEEEPPEDIAYREVMKLREPENILFHIEYVDFAGKESSRDIEIMSFQEENDKLYINAYCHLAKDRRQFLVDRIVSISFEGHTIQNPKEFFWERYKNSDLYKTQEALDEHIDEILALIFLARADGKMLKNEREVIGRYVDIIVPGINAEAVEKMLQKTTCELVQFNGILKRAKSWKPEIKKLIMDAASQIIALKKQPDPMELATFEKLRKVIE